jgi:hypothetical protein
MKIQINEYETYEFALPATITFKEFDSFSNRIIQLKKFISFDTSLNIIPNKNKTSNGFRRKYSQSVLKNEKIARELYSVYINAPKDAKLKVAKEFLTKNNYIAYNDSYIYNVIRLIRRKYKIT